MQSPSHYKSTMLMDYLISHDIGFAEGNICKYVARWDKKDGLPDLYKARIYLDAIIANAELKQNGSVGAGLSSSLEQVRSKAESN